ncbi:MAG: bifunctional helix-turn-helix transcriptional regulator/GNAT family N-acetyltransferase [Gemmatimonadales bacterium]
MSDGHVAKRVKAVRSFNRFYTRQIGALDEHLLHSPLSLGEARVLYELANNESPVASDIASSLGLDTGYLSRILSEFVKQGLVTRTRSRADGRQAPLSLTRKGRTLFAGINRASDEQVETLISTLRGPAQEQLVSSMQFIQRALGGTGNGGRSLILREHRAGDIGWVIQRHGEIYADEYGWNTQFEALVGEIASKFLRGHDPARERCWIAERDGIKVGCVFLVEKSKSIAQLRLLLVEPSARGLGLGQRLVAECIAFARAAGYRRMRLWTNDVLISARKIYQAAGFRLIDEERHDSWGKPLTSQTWEMSL